MFKKAQKLNLKLSLLFVVLLLFIMNLFAFFAIYDSHSGLLQVTFLNAGQGDAILIKGPSGEKILVDAGPSGPSLLKALSRHLYFWERDFDLVIASHADKDHIAGFLDFFKYYKSRYVSHPRFLQNKENDLSESLILSLARQRNFGAKFLDLRRGDIISFKDGLSIEILYPTKEFKSKNSNKNSLVIRVVYGNNSFMLTGDLPKQDEEIIAFFDREKLKSDVLKLAHHGSQTSSSRAFLAFVNPGFVVVSAGRGNRYGHPHKEVLQRVKKQGAQILYTWDGDVTFLSDGENVWFKDQN